MPRTKIALIGGGQVGGNIALLAAQKELGDIVIIDIPEAENFIKGKALDISQLLPHDGFDSKLVGSSDFQEIKDSDVVVITAGFPRQPGMNREDLLSKNLSIMTNVANQVKEHAPDAFVIVVSNPLDAMAQRVYQSSGLPREKVIGQSGVLDTARFRTFLAQELNVSIRDIQAYVLGGHGDTMVPVLGYTTVGGVPVSELISEKRLGEIIKRTQDGGAEIVSLLKTGSAYYAPSAGVAEMVDSIILNQHRILPCAAYLTGEYGINNLYVGVPVKIGSSGIEEIIQINLSNEEQAMLNASADAVQELIDVMSKQ